ncbi:MAG TPA: hypothetical protein VE398_22800 [Acidobacteriota bacterium]|nr:hypothetical protein [Acidobacteriota bacterium]
MARKGGTFKNIKLGKNVYRQMKRRGAPDHHPPAKQLSPKSPKK